MRLVPTALIFAYLAGCTPTPAIPETPPDDSQVSTASGLKAGRSGKPYSKNLSALYIRAFKQEEILELWIQDQSGDKFKLYHTYPVLRASGRLGPKRIEGDGQVPEGFYVVDRHNPNSQFHLSLGINYPNASDKKRSDPVKPGGDIFIHGSNVSIGCLAMGNSAIEEIYAIAEVAKKSGKPIRVDIYPFQMTKDNLDSVSENVREHLKFWNDELLPGYEWFEKHRTPAKFKVESDGRYVVTG